jgi:hypothetical protein
LFVPSSQHAPAPPRVDRPGEIHDVLATVALHGAAGTTELVIGLDLGRVIRVVRGAAAAELPARARDQLAFHATRRPQLSIYTDELYVMDVQAVERLPDAPGADDPLYLYGMLRGPYPAAFASGVIAVEGQLATTRGPLLDGLALGIQRSFTYEYGSCGASCVHALVPADRDARSAVVAFPLVPMGDDGSNELVAAQLIHDVLGALRTDLGDDLASDPIPVPNRRIYERDLVAAGWTIQGDTAINREGKGRLASLFSPARKQRLPREASLPEYVPLITSQLVRLPGWPEPARSALHARLGDHGPSVPAAPVPPPPSPAAAPVRSRPPTQPPPPPPPRRRPPTPPLPGPLPHTRPPAAPPPAPPRRRTPRSPNKPPRTVAKGLTPEVGAALWMKQLIDEHCQPDRPPPRVTMPGRAAGATVPDWMFDMIEREFPDDDK